MLGGIRKVFVLLLLVAASSAQSALNKTLKIEYEWKQFDYVWKSVEQKNEYVNKKLFDPTAMVPFDVERSADGRTFVTVIKTKGVPATLHTISTTKGPSGYLLEPYPDWSYYDPNKKCRGIINVYRVAIDSCNRLWVLDTGSVDGVQICEAVLLAFDLATNTKIFEKIINDQKLDKTNATTLSLLVTPIVETIGEKCEHTTVYMADTLGRALLIASHIRFTHLTDNHRFRVTRFNEPDSGCREKHLNSHSCCENQSIS